MTVAMNHQPPPESPPPAPRVDPIDEEVLAAFLLAEEAGLLSGVSLELWDHLPEDFCRDHELDRGRLVTRQSGSRGHQTASRRLANSIEKAARSAVSDGLHACLTVNQDVDVRLWDVPSATVRHPDVLVYRCLAEGEARLWEHSVLLAIEIVSPSSEATDTGLDDTRTGFESKMTQYASAGIGHYWIVRLRKDDSAIASIQQLRLDEDLGVYTGIALWTHGETTEAISTDVPFPITATWADLEF